MDMLHKIWDSFFDLLYPPLCLHCGETLKKENPLFCCQCLGLMTMLDPVEHCPYCFSSAFDPTVERCCTGCIDHPLLLERAAAVFDYAGPAATLVKKLKYNGQTHLALGAGAYIAAQFIAMGWPLPDYVVPMPSPRIRHLVRGFSPSLLLAQAVASVLNRPVANVLQRESGDYSQAGLSHEQRRALTSRGFSVRKGISLKGKKMLLIDDVMTTGSSLRCCAEVMRLHDPEAIYALTLCRAM